MATPRTARHAAHTGRHSIFGSPVPPTLLAQRRNCAAEPGPAQAPAGALHRVQNGSPRAGGVLAVAVRAPSMHTCLALASLEGGSSPCALGSREHIYRSWGRQVLLRMHAEPCHPQPLASPSAHSASFAGHHRPSPAANWSCSPADRQMAFTARVSAFVPRTLCSRPARIGQRVKRTALVLPLVVRCAAASSA